VQGGGAVFAAGEAVVVFYEEEGVLVGVREQEEGR